MGQPFPLGIDFQHRQVRPFVGQHNLGFELAPVRKNRPDGVRALDHVDVGDDDAAGVDDHAGAERRAHPLARQAAFAKIFAEESPEEGVVEQARAGAAPFHLKGIDIDHRRRHLAHHRGEGLHDLGPRCRNLPQIRARRHALGGQPGAGRNQHAPHRQGEGRKAEPRGSFRHHRTLEHYPA